MLKTCSKCREDKPIDSFYKRSDRPGKTMGHCKDCFNKRGKQYYADRGGKEVRMQSKYGISYNDAYVAQGGACKICRKNFDLLCIDHDHETGKARGLLCNNCNLLVGHSLENISTLANAIAYLNEYAGTERSPIPADSSVA